MRLNTECSSERMWRQQTQCMTDEWTYIVVYQLIEQCLHSTGDRWCDWTQSVPRNACGASKRNAWQTNERTLLYINWSNNAYTALVIVGETEHRVFLGTHVAPANAKHERRMHVYQLIEQCLNSIGDRWCDWTQSVPRNACGASKRKAWQTNERISTDRKMPTQHRRSFVRLNTECSSERMWRQQTQCMTDEWTYIFKINWSNNAYTALAIVGATEHRVFRGTHVAPANAKHDRRMDVLQIKWCLQKIGQKWSPKIANV